MLPGVAASSADTTHSARATYASYTTCSAGTTSSADTTYAANSSYTADTADTADAADAAHSSYATDTTYAASPIAAANIGIAVEVIVVIDVDIVATPAAAPAPAATPECAHHYADAKRDGEAGRIVSGWRIVDGGIGVDGRAIDYDGIVGRHVDDLRIRLLDHDDALVFDDFGFYLLLLGRFQIAFLLSLFTHTLDGIHNVGLLSEKYVAEVSSPLDVVGEALDDVGEGCEGLDAWIPGLLSDGVSESFVLQGGILFQPLMELNDLKGISGGGQRLGEQRVGIESNWCNQGVELVRRNFGCWGLRGCGLALKMGRIQFGQGVSGNEEHDTEECHEVTELRS
jgi:hypothetical protein